MSKQLFYTISEQIANKIRKDIIFGNIKENTPLREVELSKAYNVSRGPVRDALKELAKEGFLNLTPNVGVKVAPKPSKESLSFILNIRRDIEIFVIENILNDLIEEDFEELNFLLSKFQLACEQNDLNSIVDYDIAFHKYLVCKYHDQHIHDLWQSVLNRTMFNYDRLDNINTSYLEHKNILDSLRKKDLKATIQHINQNIQ